MPKLEVNWQCTGYDLECYRKLTRLYGERLIPNEKKDKLNLTPEFDELSGWSRASGSALHDGNHHMGTTRMSDSVNSGVVDKNCVVHGVSNLYTLGSSVFPTGGAKPNYDYTGVIASRCREHKIQITKVGRVRVGSFGYVEKPHDFLRQAVWNRSVEKHKSCLSVPLPSKYTAFHRHCQKSYNAQNDDFGESGSKDQETQSLKSEFDHKGFVISRAVSTEDLANSMFRKITSLQNSSVMWNADGSFIETEKGDAYGVFQKLS